VNAGKPENNKNFHLNEKKKENSNMSSMILARVHHTSCLGCDQPQNKTRQTCGRRSNNLILQSTLNWVKESTQLRAVEPLAFAEGCWEKSDG